MSKKVILIVDDEVDMVNVVKFYAQYGQSDFEVEVIPVCVSQKSDKYSDITYVNSSLDILDILKNTHVDVIISDFYMPGANGYELKQALLKENIETPVILMSGSHIEEEEIRKAFYVCLKKPFPPDTIGKILKEVQ